MVAIVIGALISLFAFAALVAGGAGLWADSTQRDADGWLSSPWHRFDTPTRALTAEGLRLGDVRGGPEDRIPDLGRVRVRARSVNGRPVFVAIAPEARVDAYLRDVAHTEVDGLHAQGFGGTVRPGTTVPAPPATATGWAASASGPGTQTATWDPGSGRWSIVVMNADAAAGIHAQIQVGARAPWLLGVSLGLLGGGLLLAAAAAALIVVGARTPPSTAPPPAPAAAPVEFVKVTARLDEPLSRWLWLVKGVLLIPHLLVLALLWPAFVVLDARGDGRHRHHRPLSAGAVRLQRRRGALVVAGGLLRLLGAGHRPLSAVHARARRLSRGAGDRLPGAVVTLEGRPQAVAAGDPPLPRTRRADRRVEPVVERPGLLGVLVAIAAVLLLVRGRYSREIFALVVGINRWALRVVAYAALLRDEYPPFRLDR